MSVANRPVTRPLSPHLQVYRLQLTSDAVDPAPRDGIALSVGALYLAIWVIYASASPQAYASSRLQRLDRRPHRARRLAVLRLLPSVPTVSGTCSGTRATASISRTPTAAAGSSLPSR
jgi:hypothetical protein